MRNFYVRKVRNGRVKIENKWFEVSPFTRRFDGKKFAFGVYREPDTQNVYALQMWCSEYRYKFGLKNEDDDLMVDGEYSLPWLFWKLVE